MPRWNLNQPPLYPTCPPYPSHPPMSMHDHLDFSWQPWYAGQPIPPSALGAGHDIDGSALYVGRAFYNGDNIPAKVIPSKRVAYVSWDGKEIGLQTCEIFIQRSGNFAWMPNSGNCVPSNAVPIGQTQNGETLYAGRVYHNGSLCIGKVHPSHGCCYIPFGGDEHSYRNYEILIRMY